jgi:hypothetical protein
MLRIDRLRNCLSIFLLRSIAAARLVYSPQKHALMLRQSFPLAPDYSWKTRKASAISLAKILKFSCSTAKTHSRQHLHLFTKLTSVIIRQEEQSQGLFLTFYEFGILPRAFGRSLEPASRGADFIHQGFELWRGSGPAVSREEILEIHRKVAKSFTASKAN